MKNGMKSPLAVNLVADVTMMTEGNSQSNSSKGLSSPTLTFLQSLFHEQSHKHIIAARLGSQKMMGKVSSEWWCVVDSIFLSIQKMIKIRKNAEDGKQEIDDPRKKLSPGKKGTNSSPSKSEKKEKR